MTTKNWKCCVSQEELEKHWYFIRKEAHIRKRERERMAQFIEEHVEHLAELYQEEGQREEPRLEQLDKLDAMVTALDDMANAIRGL